MDKQYEYMCIFIVPNPLGHSSAPFDSQNPIELNGIEILNFILSCLIGHQMVLESVKFHQIHSFVKFIVIFKLILIKCNKLIYIMNTIDDFTSIYIIKFK